MQAIKTAIIYTRVSSADQVQRTSLDTQEKDIRDWCGRNGYTVLQHFQDAGESAKTMDRPALIRALDEALRRNANAFIVWKLDRLSRNTSDGLMIRTKLRNHKCELISITEPTNKDPSGEFFELIMFGAAELDNKMRANRCKRGMEETTARGGWCCVPPFGYVSSRNAKGVPILLPDGHRSVVVAKALRGVLNGTLEKVDASEMLMKAGMSRANAFRVFEKPVYGGLIRTKSHPNDIRAAFDGIISSEEWYALESRINRPAERAIRNYNNDAFPLTTILVCPVCDKPLAAGAALGKLKKRYPYYWCKTPNTFPLARTKYTKC